MFLPPIPSNYFWLPRQRACPRIPGTGAAHTIEWLTEVKPSWNDGTIPKVQGPRVCATEPRQVVITDESAHFGDSSPRVHLLTPRTKPHRTKGSWVSIQNIFSTQSLLFLHSEQGLAVVTRGSGKGHLCVYSHHRLVQLTLAGCRAGRSSGKQVSRQLASLLLAAWTCPPAKAQDLSKT